ncbi:MAG: hypothetical protein BMS9Abin23_0090 [Thermodesulfobacteriota bacterium]|nr:MAG: hypothetical protein BMS9Abin23_0090 [Thermodesulfobacteriota bacterium]
MTMLACFYSGLIIGTGGMAIFRAVIKERLVGVEVH